VAIFDLSDFPRRSEVVPARHKPNIQAPYQRDPLKKQFIPLLTILVFILAAPAVRATGEFAGEPLDETLKWYVNVHGDKSEVDAMPELVLDDTDKPAGATSLSFQTAGKGKSSLWISLLGKLEQPINVNDYGSITFSYKVTPKDLDANNGIKHQVRISFTNPGVAGEEVNVLQPIDLDGEWHTLEVPISEFKQGSGWDGQDVAAFSGESVSYVGLAFFYAGFDGVPFDVTAKINNVVLKP